jgi:putative ABC transport system permease protein
VDIGADPRNVTAASVVLPGQKYPDSTVMAAFGTLLDRARVIPEVADVSLSSDLPVTTSWQSGVTFEALPPVEPGREPLFNIVIAHYDWLKTMRMRMVAGRFIEPGDVLHAPPVVVISEAVARRLGGPNKALGTRLKGGPASSTQPWLTVVGVVHDTRDEGPGFQSRGTMYMPLAQNATDGLWIAVRTKGRPTAVVPALREALARVDPDLLANVKTLEDQAAAPSRRGFR